MKKMCAVTTIALLLPALAHADELNPGLVGEYTPVGGESVGGLSAYDNADTWRADVSGGTTLIDFDAIASGTVITDDLADDCVTMVSGIDRTGVAVDVIVLSSADIPFPMFTAGTLPTEPNFISNDMEDPFFATGSTTFELAAPTTAIGAFVADGAPLDGFSIEVFSGDTSLGIVSVPPRTLPDSFVGVISGAPFDKATFFAVSSGDSWGLDNLEHNCNGSTPVEPATWGDIKSVYR